MPRLQSAFGLVVILFLAWCMSSHKTRVNWRIVVSGLALQFIFAGLIFFTEPGRIFFTAVGDFFDVLVACVDEGSVFVFGSLGSSKAPPAVGFIFAFRVLPTIIFFSSLMTVLYHLGLMQFVVKGMSWVMQRTLGTSGAETLSTAGNVFLGQTEAPLLIRPYVEFMTRSELMAVMIGGFGTIAGSVLAGFVSMGVSPVHLVTASVIAAPATLLIAKIMQPEVEVPRTAGTTNFVLEKSTVNVIDAAGAGAAEGLKLALNVAAMLIAFLALIAMFNYTLEYTTGQLFWLLDEARASAGLDPLGWKGLTLSFLLGYAFWPFAWLVGCDVADCHKVGELMGLRMVANEYVAYLRFAEWVDQGVSMSERSKLLTTYALCGFANFASIGIQLGGIGAMAPSRQADLAKLGLRAMLGGTLVCFMTACIAGILEPKLPAMKSHKPAAAQAPLEQLE